VAESPPIISAMTSPTRPLIVRLRNWVGDVVLGLPTLVRLQRAGFDLRLVGKGWARDLLAGHGWPVHPLPKPIGDRVGLLRQVRREAAADDASFDTRLNAMALPFSFSSALDMRLAGLRAIGHAAEGRSPLLARAVQRPRGGHELEVYWHLGSALLGRDDPVPANIELLTSHAHEAQAEALLRTHGVGPGFIVACPFAGGTFAKMDKTWPAFADLLAHDLPPLGRSLVVCPGPGEEAWAHEHCRGATIIEGVGLGTYAALLRRAALMIANDTGPGHIAAAVGTPVASVLGPTDPAQWRAWGPRVQLVQGAPGWPTREQVLAATRRALRDA
jgi:ADP-heptose:LPS heptosyltransferase